jgi:adenine-specific DNA-methyltransferase
MSEYSLNWNGKDKSKKEAFKEFTSKQKIKFSKENLLINADNLDALKLLNIEYKNRIDVIYIDPPYNTKNHKFLYEDKFCTCQDKHSLWLSFIYPRIILACGILSEEGVIFISIDDNEVAQLKIVCDEVFGEVNFISQLIWQKKNKPSFLNSKISKMSEYVLCYAKNIKKAPMLSLESSKEFKPYPLNFTNNPFLELTFRANSVSFTPKIIEKLKNKTIKASDMSSKRVKCELLDDIKIVDSLNANDFRMSGSWRYNQESLNALLDNGAILSVSKIPLRINYIREDIKKKLMKNILNKETYKVQTNEDGLRQIVELFGYEAFIKPKPVGLIKTLIKSVTHTKKDAIILDFFAGSGTTAEAVMELNNEDKGERKYILVQSSEKLNKTSKAFKNGYKNIYEIMKDRIKYVIKRDKHILFAFKEYKI